MTDLRALAPSPDTEQRMREHRAHLLSPEYAEQRVRRPRGFLPQIICAGVLAGGSLVLFSGMVIARNASPATYDREGERPFLIVNSAVLAASVSWAATLVALKLYHRTPPALRHARAQQLGVSLSPRFEGASASFTLHF